MDKCVKIQFNEVNDKCKYMCRVNEHFDYIQSS